MNVGTTRHRPPSSRYSGERAGERGRASSGVVTVFALITLFAASPARAGLKSEAIEAAVRHVLKQFDKQVIEELGENGAALLAKKTEELAAKYGEKEAIEAVQKVGPRVFRLVEGAGAEGGQEAIRLLARKGADGAWVVARKESLDLARRYGDDAADAMIKHKEIAEPLIAAHGKPAARALRAVDGQAARKLSMMQEAGELAKLGQTDRVLDTVGKYGDGAMNFIWKNKGALATAVVLTTFLNDPKPFIDGTRDLAEITGEALVKPMAESVGKGVADRTDFTKVIGLGVIVVGLVVAWRMLLKRRVKG